MNHSKIFFYYNPKTQIGEIFDRSKAVPTEDGKGLIIAPIFEEKMTEDEFSLLLQDVKRLTAIIQNA